MKKGIISIVIIIFLISTFNLEARRKYVILKKGETLWRIARRYGVSVEYLKRINGIKDIHNIKAGRRIYLYKRKNRKIKSSHKKKKKLNIKLYYPVKGRILSKFGEGKNLIQLNGIDFQVSGRGYVKAAYSGIVKYVGIIRGYGKVIIIQSSPSISMVYANLDRILVKKNQKINKGKVIGIAGKSTLNKKKINVLHFELLSNGSPINPQKYFD